jgi:spermidine synthase
VRVLARVPKALVLENSPKLTRQQTGWLLLSVLIVALCGIAYELIIAAVSSYLLGNSIAQFSITIGLFMFAMGIGSYLTKFITQNLVERFIQIEIAVALIGGVSAALLFVVFPFYALYKPTMYGLILIIGTLVGLEIPLLTRIISRSNSFSDSLAHVLSLDYIGALIGSVGFPLLLLPGLGLFRSSFAIGLLNISVAIIALFLLGKSHPKVRWAWFPAIGVIGLLSFGLVASSWITKYAEGQLFANEIIFTEQTRYQRIVLTSHPRNGEVRLYLDGHLQFASVDEHRYHESLVHPIMSYAQPPKSILVLGGGFVA